MGILKEWQFNVLFWVGVGGAIFLLVGPSIGIQISTSPPAVSGVGLILTYILTQKKTLTKGDDKPKPEHRKEAWRDGAD